MRVVIGDMTFHETDAEISGSIQESRAELTKHYDAFLEVAKACYIARYSTPPERTTKDEF